MKKIMVLLVLAITSFNTLVADEDSIGNFTKDKYVYLSLGATANFVALSRCYHLTIAPCAGLGFRAQSGHNGLDLSIQGRCVLDQFRIKGNACYLYYFNPNLKNQLYCGFGAGLDTNIDMSCHPLLTPELSIGRQFITENGKRRFWNVQLSPCAINYYGKVVTLSEVIVKYGFGF